MTQDDLYDHMRKLLRTKGNTPLHALSTTLDWAGVQLKPYTKGEVHLYVDLTTMPFESVETIAFLARTHGLKMRFKAMLKGVELEGKTVYLNTPYLHIYQPN